MDADGGDDRGEDEDGDDLRAAAEGGDAGPGWLVFRRPGLGAWSWRIGAGSR
ncbi:hypothetical protein [Streptomyces flavofungini]|uniref:hypothetical protein n=1 Tax=Streptomyces flavofungini TaxID=68200 RepID=UPI003F53E7F5